jgi:predicted kinase
MTGLYLVQMAGAPGSGKSTIARAVADDIGAVILNSDTVKTAMLDADVPWRLAGPAAYNVLFAVADNLLAREQSVIIDSPSHYREIPEKGLAIAGKRRATYRFIECVCDDDEVLGRRLGERRPLRSQMPGIGVDPPDADGLPRRATRMGVHRWQTFGTDGHHPVLDTLRPVAECVAAALSYVRA